MITFLTTLICIVTTVVSVLSAASNAGVAHPPAASKKGAVFRGAAAAHRLLQKLLPSHSQ